MTVGEKDIVLKKCQLVSFKLVNKKSKDGSQKKTKIQNQKGRSLRFKKKKKLSNNQNK